VTDLFLPDSNIQYIYDSTMLGDLKRCPQYYYLTHICGWRQKVESEHLRFGTEYHHGLQNYDLSVASGLRHDDAVFDVTREALLSTADWDSEHETKTRQNLIRSLIWHMSLYRSDPAETIIKADGKPAVELSFFFELDFGPAPDIRYSLCGRMDRAANYTGGIHIVDYKTSTYPPTQHFFKRYDRDNQMTFYSFAGEIVLNKPIRGVIIDAVKVGKEESVFGRGMTHRTKETIKEWLSELGYWFELQRQFANSNNWPHNDTACEMYGGCRFKEVCSTPKSLRQRVLESNFIKTPKEERWNPLKSQ
jgi:hypothetical protein